MEVEWGRSKGKTRFNVEKQKGLSMRGLHGREKIEGE